MECNDIDSRVQGAKRLMGQRVHEDGSKLANVLGWWSAVASMT
jgi:hypothetical protein